MKPKAKGVKDNDFSDDDDEDEDEDEEDEELGAWCLLAWCLRSGLARDPRPRVSVRTIGRGGADGANARDGSSRGMLPRAAHYC